MPSPQPLSVVDQPPARLCPDPRNPRRHPGAQLDAIEASIRAFGFVNPILVDPDGTIVAGEARWTVAKRMRLAAVPTIQLAHLSPVQRTAYRIADNQIPLGAAWDEAMLADVLSELQAADFDFSPLGFADAELAALFDRLELTDDAAADHVPPAPAEPLTKLGDIWQLGPHRLICGDATKPETLAALFGAANGESGRKARAIVTDPPYGMGYDQRLHAADLVLTDPPYGMSYDGGRAKADLVLTDPPYGMAFGAGKEAGSTAHGAKVKAHGVILGDKLEGAALVELIAGALKNALAFARPGAAVYVCLTWRTYAEFERALAAAGLTIAACIVWDKGSVGLGFAHYRPQHEFLFYCKGARWYGGAAEGDVWTLTRGATGEYVHPTQKPVALLERAIANSTLPDELVLDAFGGSGSTLIACERQKRVARLVELDPKYCDAIVRRWEKFTGGTAARA